jgi:hypothetical protein
MPAALESIMGCIYETTVHLQCVKPCHFLAVILLFFLSALNERTLINNNNNNNNGGEVSGRALLCCDAVRFCVRIPTFQRSMLPPASE